MLEAGSRLFLSVADEPRVRIPVGTPKSDIDCDSAPLVSNPSVLPRFAVAAILALTVGCEQPVLPQLPPDPRLATPAPPPPPEQIEPQPVHTLTPERQGQLRLLESARRRWQATTPRTYRLIVSKECSCDAG